MNTFVTCIGWFILAMLSLALACAMAYAAFWMFAKAMERFEWAVAAKTRIAVGRDIGSSAYWFSESPDTSLALRILAERIINGMGTDPNQWRDQWRAGRKQDG